MPLDIEHKIDDDLTSKGKHYAREINLVTDTLNALITRLGDQDPTSDTNQLLAAIASVQADIVYKGMVQTSVSPNLITLKSLSSLSLKKYSQIGDAIFYVNAPNTGPVAIRVGGAPAKELLYNGEPLLSNKLKPGALYHVNLAGDEAILYDSAEPIDPRKVLTIITDFDTSQDAKEIVGTGIYIYTVVHSSANLPSLNEGHLLVINHGINHALYQMYTDVVTGNVFTRSYVGGTWSAWRLLNHVGVLHRDSGTENHIVINDPAFTTYDGKTTIIFIPKYQNTGPTTLNINNIGDRNLFYNGQPLHDKTLIPGEVYMARYNGYADRFELSCLTFDQKLRDEFVGRTSRMNFNLRQVVEDVSEVRSALSELNDNIETNSSSITSLEISLSSSIKAIYLSLNAINKRLDELTDKINNG